jgi:hypothetical protein
VVSTWYPIGIYTGGFLFFFSGVVIGMVAGALRDIF